MWIFASRGFVCKIFAFVVVFKAASFESGFVLFFFLNFGSLIAFLLEHFFNELQQNLNGYKFAKPKEVSLTTVCKHISAHLGYIRQPKSIYDYVRLRRDQQFTNPIKVWQSRCGRSSYHSNLFDFFLRVPFSFISSTSEHHPSSIITNNSIQMKSLNQQNS